MAKVFSISDPANYPEKIVLEQLRNKLSDDFCVINNRTFHKNLMPCEIDFLILSQKTGIMIIEVKGYKRNDSEWVNTDENGIIKFTKDPFEQAKKNMFNFTKFLSKEYYNNIPLEVLNFSYCYAVAFPMDNFKGLKNQHKECIFSNDFNSEFQETLIKLAGPTKDKNKDIDKLWKKLSRKIEHDSDYRLFIDLYNNKLISQSEEQFTIFKKFDRGLIKGRPGTGKTILAIQKAKQLARKGHKVLLVCHNKALGNYLKYNIESSSESEVNNIRAEVWCDFMDETLINMKDEIAASNIEKKYQYYHFTLPERFIERIDDLDWRPTAVIVDEGQNFSKKPYIALQEYIKGDKNNPFLVFFDSAQDLYQGKVTERASDIFLKEFSADEIQNLNQSYRLTKNIVEYLKVKFPDIGLTTFNDKLENSFSEAKEFYYENERDQFSFVEGIITELQEKKLSGKNFVILSFKSTTSEDLIWKDFNIKYMNTVFGPDENKIMTDINNNEILIYSIGKFIGLEADAVILVDLPPRSKLFEDPDSEDARKFILGATRAKLYLFCLFKKE